MYSRKNRLAADKDFLWVKQRGRRFFTPFFTLYFIQVPRLLSSQIGFIVTNKEGNAVQRNRIKRRLRVLFRSFLKEKNFFLMVVIGKAKAEEVSWQDLQEAREKAQQFLL